MSKGDAFNTRYPWIGICGLSCVLCPMYHSESASRCAGCKSAARIAVGCAFITCALKNKGVEFCWDCPENNTCERWRNHRAAGLQRDSFKCYQTLENDIESVQERGLESFIRDQEKRERLLGRMLEGFNEGRSRSKYCVAATILPVEDIKQALAVATSESRGMDVKDKAKLFRGLLDEAASRRGLSLRLRK